MSFSITRLFSLSMRAAVLPLPLLVLLPQGGNSAENPSWTDPDTHLDWVVSDNGSGISLKQASQYCRDLRIGGFKNWTLPSIDELQTLFGGEANQNGRRVKGPIKLTGWEWSSTPGQQQGEGWVLDFGDGARASVAAGDSGLNRALCVRVAGAIK